MKKLFIYYSYTGNGQIVATHLEENSIETRQVIRKKKMPKSFFWGIMTGGFLASIKHKDKLVNFDKNIDGYDEIIIGSPIWNARFASPTNTVLKELDLKDKKVTFVLYSGSGTGSKAEKRIAKEYGDVKVIFLKEPKKYPEELDKLKEVL